METWRERVESKSWSVPMLPRDQQTAPSEIDSVWLLNPLILVVSAHHHASKDGLAFPLASATSEEEGQGREDCTHDPGDGR